MGKLEGKVAVITGGSSGMALASARRFVEEGAYVFITGRKQKALDEAVRLIGRNVIGVRGDAANLDDLDRLFDTVKREKGRIDVLYASAGMGEAVPLGEITEQHFDATFGLNTRGTLFTVQRALPLFNDGGSIFMTGSVASVKGFPGYGVYSASKAALRSFARTWLNELKGRNIRVNVLSPGPIATPMQDQVLTEEAKRMFESLIPRGKMGRPEEIAAVAVFLASDDFELREWGGVVCRRRPLGHLKGRGINIDADWRSMMSYAIVGFGKIGQALAHAFARKNIDVIVASRRPPEALAPQARAIGPTVAAKSLRDALVADTIILAVPFGEHREVAKALASWKGKTVIDAMNALVPPEELDSLPSSAFVAKAFTGAKFVKGFNHLIAATLAADPIVEGGHRVVFLSSDDEDATAPVAALAKLLGFAPVKLGKLNEGGALVHARGRTWGQLIFQDLFKKEQ